MNHPLNLFCQELRADNSSLVSVEIVQDNCGQLPECARNMVRQSYRASVESSSRWDSCESQSPKPITTHNNSMRNNKSDSHTSSSTRRVTKEGAAVPVLSFKNYNLRAAAETTENLLAAVTPIPPTKRRILDTIPSLPPRDPSQFASLNWALALDAAVKDALDSSEADGDSDEDDDSSDTDSETTITASDLDLNYWFSDTDEDSESEDEDEEEEDEDRDCKKKASSEREDTTCVIGNVRPHEWTFPPNMILPNIQSIIHEAAKNKHVDINQRVRLASSRGSSSLASLTFPPALQRSLTPPRSVDRVAPSVA